MAENLTAVIQGTTIAVSNVASVKVSIPQNVVRMLIAYVDTNLYVAGSDVFVAATDYVTIIAGMGYIEIESPELGGRDFWIKSAGAGSASILYTKELI